MEESTGWPLPAVYAGSIQARRDSRLTKKLPTSSQNSLLTALVRIQRRTTRHLAINAQKLFTSFRKIPAARSGVERKPVFIESILSTVNGMPQPSTSDRRPALEA